MTTVVLQKDPPHLSGMPPSHLVLAMAPWWCLLVYVGCVAQAQGYTSLKQYKSEVLPVASLLRTLTQQGLRETLLCGDSLNCLGQD